MAIRSLADQMNDPAHCNYCGKSTETHEWDCKICGFSKPYPLLYSEQLHLGVQSIGEFGSHIRIEMIHRPTGVSVRGEDTYKNQTALKDRLKEELGFKITRFHKRMVGNARAAGYRVGEEKI